MRAMIVIEMNVSADDITGMFNVIEMPLAVDTFNLYNSVGPLGYDVVRRVIVLCHADGDVMSLQHGHIIVTAILHTTVGVMDQSIKASASFHGNGLTDCLFQSLHGDGGTQRVGKHPTYNLVRVGVGYQMQVIHIPVDKVYISDVGHPYLSITRNSIRLYCYHSPPCLATLHPHTKPIEAEHVAVLRLYI